MKKLKRKNILKKYKETKRSSLLVYFVLRILIIVCAVHQIYLNNIPGTLLCVLCLILYTLPELIQDKSSIELPIFLESVIYIFIFAAEILGEINNFYGNIPHWDTMLHTINGFIWAGVGFSTLNLLNEHSENINLSLAYLVLVSFCFSMTIGVCWEFFENYCDKRFDWDMQKDKIITKISSVEFDENKSNKAIVIDNISETIIKTSDNKSYVIEGGYLDIGLNDTMKDMLVNLVGAVIFNLIAFFHLNSKKDDNYLNKYIVKRKVKA